MNTAISGKMLNPLLLYTGLIFGISLTIISPILIEVSDFINAPLDSMGMIMSAFSIGFILSAFSNTLLGKYRLRKKVFLVSTFILSVSVLSVVYAPNLAVLAILFFMMGICGGFIETTVSLSIIDANRGNEGLYLNLSQALIGLGAFLGPFLSTLSTYLGFGWRSSFILLAVLCFIGFVLYFFTGVPESEAGEDNLLSGSFKKIRFDLRSIIVLLLFLAIFFYVNIELGINSWIPTFLRLEKQFSFFYAGNAISYFWLCLTGGRIIIGFISKRVNIGLIILVLSFLSMITTALSIYLDGRLIITIMVAATGLFLSSIHPLILTLGTINYPRYKDFLVPLLIMVGGAGGISAPWLIGLVFKVYDLSSGINLILVFQAIVFISIMTFLIAKRFKKVI